MSVVKMEEILHRAVDEDYFVPAFNVCNLESFRAVVEGASETSSPVIVQLSMGGRRHVGNPSAFLKYMMDYADSVPVPVAFNHDHCPDVDSAIEAIELGFSGVMFDGSHLPFEENARQTRMVVEAGMEKGVAIEAELGRIPGFEDLVFSGHAEYTDPRMAVEFVNRTGCSSLAVSVGTSHGGVESPDYLSLDFDQLKAIHEALPGFPLVLHGAASLPPHLVDDVNSVGGKVPYLRNCSEEAISKCGSLGVCKANMDVDNFLCFTREVRKCLIENPEKYDPRVYMKRGMDGFRAEVEHKIRSVAKSVSRSWIEG